MKYEIPRNPIAATIHRVEVSSSFIETAFLDREERKEGRKEGRK